MINIADNTFAAACYDQNTIAELEAALASAPDSGDMDTWNLTPEQWRSEIKLALDAKLAEAAQAE